MELRAGSGWLFLASDQNNSLELPIINFFKLSIILYNIFFMFPQRQAEKLRIEFTAKITWQSRFSLIEILEQKST
jgi:hypothetical protein